MVIETRIDARNSDTTLEIVATKNQKAYLALDINRPLTYILFDFRYLLERSLSLFITFEGVEGSGKTTQIQQLRKYFTQKGIPCKVTREPGGCPIGEKIRRILLNPDHHEMVPMTELLLYEAARAQHVTDVIQPFLKKGGVVLCDRFSDATVAYQGYGRRMDLKWVERLNHLSSQGIRPDVTFLLDCPTDVGLERALRRNRALKREKEERFEREKIQFHRRVRKGYLAIAKKEPRRVKVIDSRAGEEKVFDKIREIVDNLIKGKRFGVREAS